MYCSNGHLQNCWLSPIRSPCFPINIYYSIYSFRISFFFTTLYSKYVFYESQVAHAVQYKLHLSPGSAVGICMPMTPESVAIYLGIIKAGMFSNFKHVLILVWSSLLLTFTDRVFPGCAVVSIADSFSAAEVYYNA